MRILVTGAAGLLGRWVCRAARAAGHDVVGVDTCGRLRLFGDARDDPRADDVVRASFASDQGLALVDEVDAVVHCAAQTSHPRSIAIPWEDFETNAAGTLRLLLQLRARLDRGKAIRLVHVSSAKVYGQHVDDPLLYPVVEQETRYAYRDPACRGVAEDCPLGDRTILTPFGVSKLAGDLYVQQFAALYGLDAIIVRPGCFTGPESLAVEEQNWEPWLVQRIVREEPFTIYGWGGKQVRCVLHVRDLADLILRIAYHLVCHVDEVFNAGGGLANAISILEAVRLTERLAGRKARCKQGPQRPGDWRVYVGDNALAEQTFGWSPATGVEDTFRELVAEASR